MPDPLLTYLRQWAALPKTDAELLGDFVSRQDEAAFAALVRRHGPMVLGVCRRLLPDPNDADDAFQASFLVLARKAATVSHREKLAAWLHGVARTTALRLRASNAKRRARETQVVTMPEPVPRPEGPWADLVPMLDEEVAQLPEKYRLAVVLCDLEERPRREVARHLQIPEGTLSSRLTTARKMLARRLARHGLAVSPGTLPAVLSKETAPACVPAPLVSSTVRAALLHTAGECVRGVIPAHVAALMEGVLKSMVLNKLQAALASLVVLAFAATGGLYIAHGADESQSQAPVLTAQDPGERSQPPTDPTRHQGPVNLGKGQFFVKYEVLPGPQERGQLPRTPLPCPALINLDKGQLVVRIVEAFQVPTSGGVEGKVQSRYQKVEMLRSMPVELEMVQVYDVQGKSIDRKELLRLLKQEILALVSSDPRAADPPNLRLFKEGTLLFVLPQGYTPSSPVPTVLQVVGPDGAPLAPAPHTPDSRQFSPPPKQ